MKLQVKKTDIKIDGTDSIENKRLLWTTACQQVENL